MQNLLLHGFTLFMCIDEVVGHDRLWQKFGDALILLFAE